MNARTRWLFAPGLAWGLGLVACTGGGSDDESSPDSTSADTDTSTDTSGTDTGTDTKEVDCITAASALATELYPAERECTVIVRVAHDTLEISGWQLYCGPYAPPDEATARASAASLGALAADAQLLVPDPVDQWIFYADPSAGTGGGAMVSARNGMGVFAGTILAEGGVGELLVPETWRDPAELEQDCPPWGIVEYSGWDLVDASSLDAASLEQVLDAVEHTALVAALQSYGGELRETVVLRYPRAVAPFVGESADWILALDGGLGSIVDGPCSTPLSGDASAGATVFVDKCSGMMCHGPDGNSGNAPDLSTVVPMLTDDEIVASLLCYHPAQLTVTDQQAADVLAYLREHF